MENVVGWLILKTKIDTSDFKKKLDEIKSTGSKKLKDFLKNLGSAIKEFAAGLNEVINTLLFSGLMMGVLGAIALLAKGVKDVLKETKSEDVEQIKAQIEYISNALKGAILPIVQAVANVVRRILDYVIYIGEAWFGLSKYASNYKNEVKKANKETGKLRKELAKFDDVNVLNSDKGSGEIKIPEYKGMQGEPPAWLKWIADNKDLILSVMEGVALGLVAWKLGLDKINPIGIGIAIVGIYEAVKTLLDYIKDPTWEKFGDLMTWIGIAIAGFGLAIGNLPLIVAGAIAALLGILIKNWDKIKDFIKEKLQIVQDWLSEHFGVIGDYIGGFLEGFIAGWEDTLEKVFGFVRGFVDDVVNIFNDNLVDGIINAMGKLSKIGDYIRNPIQLGVDAGRELIKNFLNAFREAINKVIRWINNKLSIKLPDWLGGGEWNPHIPELETIKMATGGIIDIPKSGARLGNAVVGEAGAEGVLPLTDDATMTRLGQEIAKWIPINLNITNELDGRILNNRLETIRQNNSFSRNGG